jgi:hypothetical protein
MGSAGFQGVQWKKLAPPGDLFSINFDEDGPSIGPVRLLKRTESGWTPRSAQELDFIFDRTLERETEFTGKMRGLNAVARALNKGDMAHAMLVTLFTDLPALNGEAALHCAVVADTLAKAGFNPDQDRDEQGRWTSEGSAESPAANGFTPAQMFIPEAVIPFMEQILPVDPPLPTPPFPGDILPPITGTPDIAVPRTLQNPYPRDPDCAQEWETAREYCGRLAAAGLLGGGDYKEHGRYYEQCVRGQVSERCGGNPVDRTERTPAYPKKPRGNRSSYELLT